MSTWVQIVHRNWPQLSRGGSLNCQKNQLFLLPPLLQDPRSSTGVDLPQHVALRVPTARSGDTRGEERDEGSMDTAEAELDEDTTLPTTPTEDSEALLQEDYTQPQRLKL